MSQDPVKQLEVIAPNFKKRLSGVTTTILQLIPMQRMLGIKIAALGFSLPDRVPRMRWWRLVALWSSPVGRNFRIWHARRNSEMLAGILMRDLLSMKLRLVFTSASQRTHQPFTKWMIRRMNRVIATSARSGSYLEVDHHVILHGVDLSRFKPAQTDEEKSQVAHYVKQFPGNYRIGCFGRIRPSKGTDLFVDAMIALLPHYPDWTAIVAGCTTSKFKDYEHSLREKIAAAGLETRIIFLGEIREIAPFYRCLSLYVAPSRWEGFGLTPLEAMASEKAVIASNAGVYPELVPPDAGIIVPADNGEALQKAIEIYFSDPERAIRSGKYGLAYVQQFFPLIKEAEAINQLYEEMFSEG